MKFNVVGITVDADKLEGYQLNQFRELGGRNAGLCHTKDLNFYSMDCDKALELCKSAIDIGHHSVVDHVNVEVVFEGVSKMLALVLNSLQDYATSERPYKYTELQCSERERTLYEKWQKIFESRVLELEPTFNDNAMLGLLEKKVPSSGLSVVGGRLVELESKFNDKDIAEIHEWFDTNVVDSPNLPSKKVAMENARYVLSVFNNSTTFGYSTSVRQWNYIYDWCIKYCDQYYPNPDMEYVKVMAGGEGSVKIMRKQGGVEASFFETCLYYDLLELSNKIWDTLYMSELRDNKDRSFSFLTSLSGDTDCPLAKYDMSCFEPNGYTGEFDYLSDTYSHMDSLGLAYSISYTASFVQIGRAERYRAIKYYTVFNPNAKQLDFFLPPMLVGTDYADEWLSDLSSISDIIPQATKVAVIEIGFLGDFVAKCEEQLSSKAQWECMNQTRLTAMRFADAVKEMEITSPVCKEYIYKFIDKNTGRCKAGNILNRLF